MTTPPRFTLPERIASEHRLAVPFPGHGRCSCGANRLRTGDEYATHVASVAAKEALLEAAGDARESVMINNVVRWLEDRAIVTDRRPSRVECEAERQINAAQEER